MRPIMDNRWADIVVPAAAPPETSAWWWATALVLLLLIGVLLYRRRPRVAMRRRLKQLQRRLDRDPLAEKTAGFIIADCLRRAYDTPRLDKVDFAERQNQWRQFIRRLQGWQYQPEQPPRSALRELLREAQQWVRR
jgi:hypothetical protein